MRLLRIALALPLMMGSVLASPVPLPSRADSPSQMPVLLGLPAVRKALGITDAQGALLDVIRADYKAKCGVVSAAGLMDDDLSGFASGKLAKFRTRYNQRVLAILTPEQTVKFRRLERGIDGGIFLTSPSEQEFLKLTPKQKEKVQEILRADSEKAAAVRSRYASGTISQLRRDLALHRIRRTTDRSMLHLLSADQRRLWAENLTTCGS